MYRVVQHRAATGSQQRIRQQTKRNGSDIGRRTGVLGRFEDGGRRCADGGLALAGRRARVPPAGLAPPSIPQQRPALDGLGVRVPLPAPPPTARRIIGYYISHHKHQDNNRTRAMHALELYVVTKLTNKSARHYGLLLHLTVRCYHGSYGLTGTKTFSKPRCGCVVTNLSTEYALKGVAFTGLGYHYQPSVPAYCRATT